MSNIISILGVQTELIPMQRDKLRGINADMFLRFSFYMMEFNNQSLCVIQAKNKHDSLTPLRYKQITKQAEIFVGMPVVVILDSLTYYERERMINQGVYFIISDKYAFLPSLIVNVQAKKKDKNPSKLTPVAQYVLLYYLLSEESKEEYTIKDLEHIMPYNYVALARAVASLENCKLCSAEIKDNTGIKYIHFDDSKRELWTKAQSYLSSPVKKVLYGNAKPEGDFSISGVNALSQYSHLNSEQYETQAIWNKLFSPSGAQFNEVEGLYKIEIWKYPTTMPFLSNHNVVDKLSLYLSMKDEPDARIEKELEIIIEEMKW
ncbi:MAG: hypothetical protein PF484_08205 [Bacteroidales bacterium]|jgi:hypothetical protein|nr:hypothetical protein [Bacteroidales bacterium]